MRYVAL
jgi:hypothetical protein